MDSASTRGSARQARVVGGELALDRRVVGAPRPRARSHRQLGRDVEHVHEQARALDVREEVVPEPGAVAGALDQPGDVGDDQLALLALEHAEHRRERRERIVGDLRRGARQARQQRGLARVRQAHEADVREQLQLQLEPALLAGQPALGEARRLARGRGEALVALAAAAAARDRGALAVREQLPAAPAEVAVVVLERADLGAGRHADLSVSPSAPWRCEPSPCPPRPAR